MSLDIDALAYGLFLKMIAIEIAVASSDCCRHRYQITSKRKAPRNLRRHCGAIFGRPLALNANVGGATLSFIWMVDEHMALSLSITLLHCCIQYHSPDSHVISIAGVFPQISHTPAYGTY